MRPAVLLALFVSACAASTPAPISYGGEAQHPRAERQQPLEQRPRPQTPAPDWAAGEGTPLSAFALQPDEAQPYDPRATPRTHRVGANESLYDIATAYQIPLRALIEQNRLEPPFTLAPGRELELPPPRLHRVARGESFEDIARRYNVDLRSLALLNRMQPPYLVRQGEAIVLPALARARVETPPVQREGTAQTPTAPAQAGTGRFAWPARGEVLARFGAQSDGRRLDGVEIAVEDGGPIAAAADGDVVYAGDDLPAYGTLVLIRHADNYVTAYGYAQSAAVREGQRVRAGERIAEAGSRARMLFQVRQGAQAVDPLPLLGAR